MSAIEQIFKAYDVRGTYPDQIDAALCRRIGAAFACFATEESPGTSRVVVARDMRPSGPELVGAFTAGVLDQGLDVIDIGLVSTDMLYFASGRLDAPGAVFTASHNPARYNGIKMCLSGARPVGEDSGLGRIRELAGGPAPAPVASAGTRSEADLLAAFADHVRSFVDVGLLKPLRIVADTANGMGGLVVPEVFRSLPFHLEVLFPELDGTFPNHPADPIQPENLRDLQARVVETGADIGLAFDGDADRVFLVDEAGSALSGSTTTAIVAAGLLDRNPGRTVIHNLICSKAVPEIVREHGGVPVRTRVGHSFIKARMAETDALFGGEHSAHYYFQENWRADSGCIAALVVLEQLCRAGVPLSELRKPFERYAASGEINTTVVDQAATIEAVAAHYRAAAQDRLDGLTVDCGDWWFNLRPSNTEPLLRLNLEAATEEAVARHVAEVRSLLSG
jgi:phosphomannomutase